MDFGALGAEAISSPLLFARGFADKDAANEFAGLKDERREALPSLGASDSTVALQEAAIGPLLEAITSSYKDWASGHENAAELVSDYFSDPRVAHTLGATELAIPSVARGAKALIDKPDLPSKLVNKERGIIDITGKPITSVKNGKIKPSEFDGSELITKKRKFAQLQSEARQAMSPADRAQVDTFDPEDFDGQIFLTPEGDAGFSMTKDGYVGHVFKHPDSPRSGTIGAALTKARGEGAKNLEAFDTYLVKAYTKAGAKETGRLTWNPEFASPEMLDALGVQSPDYVQMAIGGHFPEYKHSKLLGPREQKDFERLRATPKRGDPYQETPRITEGFSPENTDNLIKIFESGVEQGYDKWYHTGGILDDYITNLGPEQGVKNFEEFIDLGSILSPRSDVATEIKRASMLQKMLRDTSIEHPLDNEQILDYVGESGYGHLNTAKAVAPAFREWMETGSLGDGMFKPKTPSYSENKKGNFLPVTADGHNVEIITGQKGGPKPSEYGFFEDRQKEIARALGYDPAEWQSGLWGGGSEITGVRDPRNYTASMNQRVAKTATDLDMTEEEVAKAFEAQELILRALAASVGTGGIAAGMQQETPSGL